LSTPVAAEQNWEHVCAQVGHFAGLLTEARQAGKSEGEALAAASSTATEFVSNGLDKVLADKVYAADGIDREQNVQTTFVDCMSMYDKSTVVSDLTPISVRTGTNRVQHLTEDGKAGTIVLRWQDEGKGRGHDRFSVFVTGDGDANESVKFWPETTFVDDDGAITDVPGHDYDMVRSVRLASANVHGEDTTVILVADRGDNPTMPSKTKVEIFRLLKVDLWYVFTTIQRLTLPVPYCNADLALSAATGLPLRESYKGPRTANGCSQ
jgi:hypothetical protein